MSRSVLDALTEAWSKFGTFVKGAMNELHIPESEREKVEMALGRDVIVVIPSMRAFLTKHARAIEAKDVAYFRLLFPEEHREREVPAKITEKAFIFARVFQSLINDVSDC